MTTLLSFTIVGLFTGAAYAIAASGLVLTYTTTRVFNLAHGAIGMVMAFTCWQLKHELGMPDWLALLLVLLVIAPAFGIVIERVMMRGLGDAPCGVGLVVTVGLFVGLIGLAQALWPPAPRTAQPFFGTAGHQVGEVFVSYHSMLTIVLSVVVAGGLYLLLNRTQLGTLMRAAADNPELVSLYGGRSAVAGAMSWAIGASLGALAGIVLAPVLGLDYYELTLLVVNAYAAAMLGRLRSLPMTFVGAMVLGLLQAYAVGYLPTGQLLAGLRAVIPALLLFVVLLFVPQTALRVGRIGAMVSTPVPVPTFGRSVAVGVVVVLAAWVAAVRLPVSSVVLVGQALVYAMVMLSLVLLTGYGGHVSLTHLTFVGIGAAAVAKLASPSPVAVLVAAVIAAGVGVLVALSVLRLTGLYLALATLAFGLLMDRLVFQAPFAFGSGGSLGAVRIAGVDNERGYLVLIAAVFVLMAIGLLALRRGRVGRLLIAMRDSPAACSMLGLNPRWFRVALFAVSAGMAGVAGALYAGLRQTVTVTDFQGLSGLPLLLLAVVCGLTSASGALVGGFLLMLLPVLQSAFPGLGGLVYLIIGFGAVALGRDPNGLASLAFRLGRWVLRGRSGLRVQRAAAPAPSAVLVRGEVAGSGVA